MTSNFDGVVQEINAIVLATRQSLQTNVPSIVVNQEKLALLHETVSSVLVFNASSSSPSPPYPPGMDASSMSGGNYPYPQTVTQVKQTKKL